MSVGVTENLTELENLTEETLLAELKARYNKDTIYTYVGEILVAVNPFKVIDSLYSQTKAVEYTNIGDRSSRPPHIFAVADTAFEAMSSNPPGKLANQVCVISGESGAGKTESAKLFIKQTIYLSSKMSSQAVSDDEPSAKGLEEKIIQLNPLLEAWGNAQTLMNDNSSRFGKFIELRFNEQLHVQGVLMYEYLLEKSRVVNQSAGEQNFHVFYLFYAGLTEETKAKYHLVDAGEHRYLNSSDEAIEKIHTKKCKDMWNELKECMTIVGFTDEEADNLWSLLAGVLHVGDIEFGGEDQAYIVSDADVLGKVCDCLGVETEALKDALTCSVNIMRGENVVRAYKVYEAEDARDAMAKSLYGRAFSSIVQKVNTLLGPKNKRLRPNEKTIGILDIFGFECFDHNSFEQLLINLANEQLQFFFNNHIFKMELDEYAREGIDGSNISFEDNQPLLDLLLRKPNGLLSVCDEEAFFPKATDVSMVAKFHTALADGKAYERPRGDEPYFTIHHYAGKVKYQAEGFLEKNRDTLAVDVVGCLRLSENMLIRNLFGADADDDKAAKKAAKTKAKGAADVKKKLRQSMKKVAKEQAKAKKITVGTAFKTSLAELMEEMSGACPHFVRCIKPNMIKSPAHFEDELVTKQLRYTGMLETTRIRKEGYSYRPLFGDFVNRYKILGFGYTSSPPPTSQTCARILAKAGVSGYQVGHTKVFLRYFHADQMNEALRPFPAAAAKLAKVCKGFVARSKVRKMLAAAAEQRKLVDQMFVKAEKFCQETVTVMEALIEEDNMRPEDFFKVKQKKEAPAEDKNLKKFQKSIKKQIKKEGFTRAASVRWFKEVEMKKGAGMSDNGFQEWFHGVITRRDAEALLKTKEAGCFLVRVSESRFGYSLSHVIESGGRIKHYMIDQTPDGRYQVVGNRKLFPSLNELVEHHKVHKVVSTDPVPLINPCGQVGGEDDREEFLKK